jgi:hypothetical protein
VGGSARLLRTRHRLLSGKVLTSINMCALWSTTHPRARRPGQRREVIASPYCETIACCALETALITCKVFMPSFIVDCFVILCCDFSCSFEVSLLAEVRLRASFSAPKRTPVANDAPALFSALSCFSFDNNKTTKR